MKAYIIIPVVILFSIFFHTAYAEVLVHENEYAGYFDSSGVYTVFGSVRNLENQPVLAKIQVTVNSQGNTFSKSEILPTIYPSKDMPFKFKFPLVSSKPILENPKVSYITTNSKPLNLEIIYGKTLIRHPDGHLTGFISNVGNKTQHNVNVYALVHSKDNEFLDEVQSSTPIPTINPGMKAQFVMFPDPVVAKNVTYYSCFVPGADNAIEMSTDWKGKKFFFSVLSIVYFSNQKFNTEDNSISFDAANPWQLPYFANFMFPAGSSNGNLQVFIDGKKVDALVSKDDHTGNWHVAFNVDFGQHKLRIVGFDPNYTPTENEYFYLDAKSALTAWGGYSTFTISDPTLLQVLGIKGEHIPFWAKHIVKYILFDNLPPDEVVNCLKYLYKTGVIT